MIGKIAASIATLDFSETFSGIKESFSIGGKLFGIFGGDEEKPPALKVPKVGVGTPIGQDMKSTTDINVNMNAPEGVIQSIQSRTQGRAANVGVNMAAG